MVITLVIIMMRQGSEKVAPFTPTTQPLTVENAPPNIWSPPPPSIAWEQQPSQWPSLHGDQGWQGYSGPAALSAPTPVAPAGRLEPLPQSAFSGMALQTAAGRITS